MGSMRRRSRCGWARLKSRGILREKLSRFPSKDPRYRACHPRGGFADSRKRRASESALRGGVCCRKFVGEALGGYRFYAEAMSCALSEAPWASRSPRRLFLIRSRTCLPGQSRHRAANFREISACGRIREWLEKNEIRHAFVEYWPGGISFSRASVRNRKWRRHSLPVPRGDGDSLSGCWKERFEDASARAASVTVLNEAFLQTEKESQILAGRWSRREVHCSLRIWGCH